MTYKEIRANEEVNALLDKGNKNLGLLGFTDHSKAHCTHVAETAGHILKKFNYDAHDIELAKIAGYMHDIGNAINRILNDQYDVYDKAVHRREQISHPEGNDHIFYHYTSNHVLLRLKATNQW